MFDKYFEYNERNQPKKIVLQSEGWDNDNEDAYKNLKMCKHIKMLEDFYLDEDFCYNYC